MPADTYCINGSDPIINPCRLPGEKPIGSQGILAVNPADIAKILKQPFVKILPQHPLFHGRLVSNEQFFLAGPAVGAPMAVLTMEKLIALGASCIIHYGWCGSLQHTITPGDVLVADSFFSEEGTSRHYPVRDPRPDDTLGEIITQRLTEEISLHCHRGMVWTIDAPYRETREKVRHHAQKGILAVDMESSALCTVAAFRQIRFVSVLLVSDSLLQAQWQPQFSSKKFLQRSMEILEALCRLLNEHNRGAG